jgi:hypothetical protein
VLRVGLFNVSANGFSTVQFVYRLPESPERVSRAREWLSTKAHCPGGTKINICPQERGKSPLAKAHYSLMTAATSSVPARS